jgi:hypothetical protein
MLLMFIVKDVNFTAWAVDIAGVIYWQVGSLNCFVKQLLKEGMSIVDLVRFLSMVIHNF